MWNHEGYSNSTAEAIDSLLGYRNEVVMNRYMAQLNVDKEYADRVFYAFNQFMATSVLTDGQKTTSPVIDSLWHVFILNTRQYSEFCEKYLRGFVHHEPSRDDVDPQLYVNTRSVAKKLFGSLDDECWPEYGKPGCSSNTDPSVRRFN